MAESKEKFHFQTGDILIVSDTNSGESSYGKWQWIKVNSPNQLTNSQIFLAKFVENLHAGDRVRVDKIILFPQRAKVLKRDGNLKWDTIFKADIEVSVIDGGGFATSANGADYLEVNHPESEELPF